MLWCGVLPSLTYASFDVHNRKTMEKLRDFWIAYALHGHWEQMRTKPGIDLIC